MPTEELFLDNSGTPIPLAGGPPERLFRLPLSSSEDRWRNYPSRDQRPARLTQILENADAGDPRELFEFIEEMVEKDLKIRSAYRTRIATILGTPWDVVPAEAQVGEEELAAEIAINVKRWIQKSNLREMRKHQLDAIGKPFAVSWINWTFVTEEGKLRAIPQSFTPMTGRRFRWNPAANFGNNADPTDQLLYFENLSDREGVPLPPRGTIRSLFNDQTDHPTRAGLLRGFLFPYAFKITALKDWVSYVDKNGIPIRVLTVSADDFSDPDIFARILASVRDLASNAHGIFPDGSKIEIHAPVGSVEVFKQTCDYLDKAFAQALLGHELSSQSSPGPGQLGITAAESVRQDVLEGDCEDYAPMERRDVYEPLVGFNYGWDVVERGLTPYLKFNTEPPLDTAARVKEVTTLAGTFKNMPFSKQQFRKEFGIDAPVDFDIDTEDDVIFASAEPSPFGGGSAAGGGADGGTPNPLAEDAPVEDGDVAPLQLAAATALIAAASEGGGALVRLKPSQRTVDRITNRAISSAESELLAMRGPIKKLISRAKEESWSHQQLVQAVVRLFDEIPLKRTERLLVQARTMARIFGKTTRAK